MEVYGCCSLLSFFSLLSCLESFGIEFIQENWIQFPNLETTNDMELKSKENSISLKWLKVNQTKIGLICNSWPDGFNVKN